MVQCVKAFAIRFEDQGLIPAFHPETHKVEGEK